MQEVWRGRLPRWSVVNSFELNCRKLFLTLYLQTPRTMADRLSKEERSELMSHIRSVNTKPEVALRRALWRRGFRYRVNVKNLPGSPDIVLPKHRTVVFVHGCFWHGHEGCKEYTVPKTNTEFWVKKIRRNQERDLKVQHELASMGWHCITVWECELKPNIREKTLESLAYTLNKIFLQDRTIHRYEAPEEQSLKAAENTTSSEKM